MKTEKTVTDLDAIRQHSLELFERLEADPNFMAAIWNVMSVVVASREMAKPGFADDILKNFRGDITDRISLMEEFGRAH